MLKEFLSQMGIGFEEHDITRDAFAAREVVRITGQSGVPVTIINGQIVVGFDQPRLEQLIAQSQAGRGPTFGAATVDASEAVREGAPTILGAYVGRARSGPVAERMGLASDDIIIQLNMRRIASVADLERALSSLKESTRLSLVFIRSNTVVTAETML